MFLTHFKEMLLFKHHNNTSSGNFDEDPGQALLETDVNSQNFSMIYKKGSDVFQVFILKHLHQNVIFLEINKKNTSSKKTLPL